MNCTLCNLHKYRTKMVLGRGVFPAQLLIIGESPGISEDATGKAFVGQSGKLFDMMLSQLPKVSFYIMTCVLCRPCDSLNGPNRPPSKEEILKCNPNTMEIIKKVKPTAVVLAGKIAEDVFSKEFPDAFKIQHPAFLLRTGGMFSPYWIQNSLILEEAVNYAVQNQ